MWSKLKIVGLFSEEVDVANLLNSLHADFPTHAFTAIPLPEQDWAQTWLAHFQPMKFGNRLWITPPEHAIPSEEKDPIIVKLAPGLAFGTGTHVSTALCLEWLDQNLTSQQTILDYGCGSGILAIAALKLGAQTAFAVDYDPQAILATNENGSQNEFNEVQLITLTPEAVSSSLQVEVVVANILAEALVSLAPILQQHCLPGGHLVLSGLLTNQIEKVQAAYHPWFVFDEPTIKEEWALLSAKKLK